MGAHANGRKIRCLLVEDEPNDTLRATNGILNASGDLAEIHAVESLAECRAALKTFSPDVILMDLLLPDSDAQSTYYSVVREAWPRPIIMLTGCAKVISYNRYTEQAPNENIFCKDTMDYKKLWARIVSVTQREHANT